MWDVLLLVLLVFVTWMVVDGPTPPITQEGFWGSAPSATQQRGLPPMVVPSRLQFRETQSLQPFTSKKENGQSWSWSELVVKGAYAPAFDGMSSMRLDLLRWVISRGVRCVHFEVFASEEDGLPVVGLSNNAAAATHSRVARDVLRLNDVIKCLCHEGFQRTYTPNATDPLIAVFQLQCEAELFHDLATRVAECLQHSDKRRYRGLWTKYLPFDALRNQLLIVFESQHILSAQHPLRKKINAVANDGFVRVARDAGPWMQPSDINHFTIAMPIGNPMGGWLSALFRRNHLYEPVRMKEDLVSSMAVNAIMVPYFRADTLRSHQETLFPVHAWIPKSQLAVALQRLQ